MNLCAQNVVHHLHYFAVLEIVLLSYRPSGGKLT